MHPIITWLTVFFFAMIFVYIMNLANLFLFMLTGTGQWFIFYCGIAMLFMEQYVLGLVREIDLDSL